MEANELSDKWSREVSKSFPKCCPQYEKDVDEPEVGQHTRCAKGRLHLLAKTLEVVLPLPLEVEGDKSQQQLIPHSAKKQAFASYK
jgi:hypothetical protein